MERCLILHGTKLCQLLASRSVCKWRVQPRDSDLKERFLSFACLFIYFFCHPHFLFFFLLTFFVIRIFFHPHFPIRIRHPQVSGPRFTDTPCLHVLRRKCRTWSRSTFFSLPAHFHLALVATGTSHFVTVATKFSCCSSSKKDVSSVFISRSRPLLPFFSLSFAGLPPTFSFSLSLSCSIFQICCNKRKQKLVHYVVMEKKRIIRDIPGIKKKTELKKFPSPPYLF